MPNRLAKESSPYLLQHAENPVDWYPWGSEALAAARRRDVPILLSIGYSACHWCHVMERESFEDPQTAEVMNERFVNIKVDREERPDVDAIYMKAIQSLTGHGGWPLTAFLMPDGRPFFGGTYFPPLPRHGLPSFRHVLETTADAYADRRDQVDEAAAQIHELLERASKESDPGTGEFAGEGGDTAGLLEHAARSVSARFDMKHGGFGGAPKFPQSDVLELLLRHHLRTGKPRPLEMVVHTLRRMGRGGIYDQLGGGFHRYTVDAAWLVPHFEKMLYDNALLARLYVRTFQATEDDELRSIAEGTLDYVVRDLRSPEGGFYSARDADSEGEEGLFYLWKRDEVVGALGRVDGELFCRLYDVSAAGNFEGRNILHVPHDPGAVAESAGLTLEGLAERIDAARRTLSGLRAEREPPFRDDKILAGWNGLMVQAFAEAGAVLERPDYLEIARDGAAFILGAMRIDDRLLHSYKDGLSKIDGFLEDYGAVGQALLTLHEATLESRWLEEALWVAERMIDLFWNEDESAFYDNARDAEELVVRPRDITDNATPSGNSLAVELLFRLGHLVSEPRWTDVATRVVRREVGSVERFPAAFGRLGSAMSWLVDEPQEIVVLGPLEASGTAELLAAAWSEPHNARVITGGAPGEAPRIPLLESRSLLSGSPTAYVCEQFTCKYPVVTPGQLAKLLRTDRPNQEASSAAGQGSLP